MAFGPGIDGCKKGNLPHQIYLSKPKFVGKKLVNWLQGKWLLILDSKSGKFNRKIEAKSTLIQGLFWISQLAAWTLLLSRNFFGTFEKSNHATFLWIMKVSAVLLFKFLGVGLESGYINYIWVLWFHLVSCWTFPFCYTQLF